MKPIQAQVSILIITLAVTVFAQSGCSNKSSKSPIAETPKTKEDAEETAGQNVAQKVLSFNLEGYKNNGEKRWELKGACADILSNVIKLDYVTAKAYGDEVSMTLNARTGIYDKQTKDIHLETNVVGRTSDGAKLMTDKLDWIQKTECVSTNSTVRIEKDNLVSMGRGAVGSPGLKQVELKRDVVVEIKDKPPTVITCSGPLVVNYAKNVAVLNKNVKVTDQRGDIYSDCMKILFDKGTRKITRVVAIGNVRIQREGNFTNSDRAIYTVFDGRVRLVGKPKIVVIPDK